MTQSDSLGPDGEYQGVLLGEDQKVTAADLYDPATGKAQLVPGVPLDLPAPTDDAVRTGVIDSGVIPDHPQLRGLVVAMKDFVGNDPIDRVGHGTLVALRFVEGYAKNRSAVLAKEPSLAAKLAGSPAIVSAKVTDASGKIALDRVIEAVHWMAEQNVRVVNMSLGFLGKKERYQGLSDAIAQYAERPNNGILFSAAAGNFGPDVLVYPAACDAPNLISVGAVIEGKPWAKSGKGDFVAEGRVTVVPADVYYFDEAQQLARAGDYERARQQYQASLAVERNANALFGIAILDLHAGDAASAVNGLSQAAALAPNTAEIEAHLGAAMMMLNRVDEAKTHLDRAIELDPNDEKARVNRAKVLIGLGALGAALQDLLAARSLTQDTGRIDAMIGDLTQKLAALARNSKG